MTDKARNTGVDVKAPKDACKDDKNCPFHGSAGLHGRLFKGKVVRAKVPRVALVEWNWLKKVPKYERYAKKKTRVHAHNPECIAAKEGDIVRIMETKKISKTKNFIIIEKLEEKGDMS